MGYPFDAEEDIVDDEINLDLQMIREDLISELEAVNQYQDHIETLTDDSAVRVLQHILDDEKEHVAELFKLIQQLDSVQAEKFMKEKL